MRHIKSSSRAAEVPSRPEHGKNARMQVWQKWEQTTTLLETTLEPAPGFAGSPHCTNPRPLTCLGVAACGGRVSLLISAVARLVYPLGPRRTPSKPDRGA